MIYRLILFLVLNFGALTIGSLFTSQGVPSDWYQTLAKAPWTPPGWMFGFAWTAIMICFSFYMTSLWVKVKDKLSLFYLYIIQWILNVMWNPVFFYFQETSIALLIILLLTIIVFIFMLQYSRLQRQKTWLLIPYFLWLLIASSLNLYIVYAN